VIDYKGEIDDVIDARLGDRLRNVEWHKTQPRFGGKGSASLQEAKCRAERLFSRFLKQIKVTKFYTNTLCAQKKKKNTLGLRFHTYVQYELTIGALPRHLVSRTFLQFRAFRKQFLEPAGQMGRTAWANRNSLCIFRAILEANGHSIVAAFLVRFDATGFEVVQVAYEPMQSVIRSILSPLE